MVGRSKVLGVTTDPVLCYSAIIQQIGFDGKVEP